MRPKGCPETSKCKYQLSLLNIPEEWLIILFSLWRNPEIARHPVIMIGEE
jgi:hypothetical protein